MNKTKNLVRLTITLAVVAAFQDLYLNYLAVKLTTNL